VAFLIDQGTKVLVQGITGRLGTYSIGLMRGGGTAPVAGVTPGRGGSSVEGIPVFDTVREARDLTGVTASILFIPARGLEDAAMEAIEARMDPIVVMVDGVPLDVSLRITAEAARAGVTLIGPNSPGVISPGKASMAALRASFYREGHVAILSRSGGMMTTIAHTLSLAGIGQSTCVGVGGDAIIGLDLPAAALLAERDEETAAIAVFGEIGTDQEQRLSELVRSRTITKPIVAYIAGSAASSGVRYSHAGAMSQGESTGAAGKRAALRAVGVTVVDRYTGIPQALEEVLKVTGTVIKTSGVER